MSWLSQFVFRPVENAVTNALGITPKATGTASTVAAQKSPAIAALEADVLKAVQGFTDTALGQVPVIGGLATPAINQMEALALDYTEQHIIAYVSSIFAHVKTVATTGNVPSVPQS